MAFAPRFPFRVATIRPVTVARSPREQACRRYVSRQALKAAGVSALPVAGVDLLVGGELLSKTIERINAAYGLSPDQIAALPGATRSQLDNVIREVGSYLIGQAVTKTALLRVARSLGMRIGMQQAAKLAPVAGLVASGALSGWLFKRLGDRHIAQCERVRQAMPELPPAPPVATLGFSGKKNELSS